MTGPGRTRVTGQAARRFSLARAGGPRGAAGARCRTAATLDRFEVEQGSRYFTLYPQDEGVDLADALRHAANMHVIPANAAVRRVLESAKAGNVVTMHGRLVDVRGDDGFTWRTSLRRDDTGDGACELFWADEIELQ